MFFITAEQTEVNEAIPATPVTNGILKDLRTYHGIWLQTKSLSRRQNWQRVIWPI